MHKIYPCIALVSVNFSILKKDTHNYKSNGIFFANVILKHITNIKNQKTKNNKQIYKHP